MQGRTLGTGWLSVRTGKKAAKIEIRVRQSFRKDRQQCSKDMYAETEAEAGSQGAVAGSQQRQGAVAGRQLSSKERQPESSCRIGACRGKESGRKTAKQQGEAVRKQLQTGGLQRQGAVAGRQSSSKEKRSESSSRRESGSKKQSVSNDR
jgi:hypothetical protein